MSALEGVELIHQAGGLAVMAHPGLNRSDDIIPALVRAGLDGIECFHTKHSTVMAERYLEIAEKYGLLVTGGSDSHEPETVGRSYTVFPDSCTDADGVMKALLAGMSTTSGTDRNGMATLRYGKKAISEWIGRGMKRM